MFRNVFDSNEDSDELPSTDWFSLGNTVGLGRANNRHDVFKVESLLANTGDLDTSKTDGPTGYGLYTVDEAVRKFQDRNGLKVDGWLRPDGPTIGKLKDQLGGKLAGFPAPSITQLEAHRASVAKGEAGLLNMKMPDIPLKPIPIIADRKTHGSNESWVDWLLQNRGGFDEAPAMLATYIKNFGMEGVAHARDFVAQWDARKPGDGANAVRAILSCLPDDEARRIFVGGDLPDFPPIGTLTPQALRTLQIAQARTTMTDAQNDGALPERAQSEAPSQQVAQAQPQTEGSPTPTRRSPDRPKTAEELKLLNSKLLEGIGFAETRNDPNLSSAVNAESGAARTYQITPGLLNGTGLRTADGKWTPGNVIGVSNDEEFRRSPEAQKRAASYVVHEMYREAENNGVGKFEGQELKGIRETFTVTPGGVAAALHRAGTPNVMAYFKRMEAAGWDSNEAAARIEARRDAAVGDDKRPIQAELDWHKSIETRLRTFRNVPYP